MKKIMFLFCVLLFGSSCFALNCDQYLNYDENRLFEEGTEYSKYYIPCVLNKKIAPLNKTFQFKQQDDYWSYINFMLEHFYANNKLDDKIDNTIYSEHLLYELGVIALGHLKYVGPKYSTNQGWYVYMEEMDEKYSPIKKLSDVKQYQLINKVNDQISYFKNNYDGDFEGYYFNTYIVNLVGFAHNITNKKTKMNMLRAIVDLYVAKSVDKDIFRLVDGLYRAEE